MHGGICTAISFFIRTKHSFSAQTCRMRPLRNPGRRRLVVSELLRTRTADNVVRQTSVFSIIILLSCFILLPAHLPIPFPLVAVLPASLDTQFAMLQRRSLRLLSSLSSASARPLTAQLGPSLRCRSARAYSIHADASVGTKIQDIDPTKLSIEKTTTPKALLPPEELIFGRNFTGNRRLRNFSLLFC